MISTPSATHAEEGGGGGGGGGGGDAVDRETAAREVVLLRSLANLVREDRDAVYLNYGALPSFFQAGVPCSTVVELTLDVVKTHLRSRGHEQFTIHLTM